MALILMVYGQDISETKAKFGTLMADIGLIHSTNLIGAYWYSSSKGARGGGNNSKNVYIQIFSQLQLPPPPPLTLDIGSLFVNCLYYPRGRNQEN